MKKIQIVFAFLLGTGMLIAQDETNRILEDKGDVIAATIYHDNGEVEQTGFYNKQGKLHGTWISYDANGSKTAVAQYQNGNKVGTWYFYDGEKLREVSYDNNRIAEVVTWKGKEAQVVSNYR